MRGDYHRTLICVMHVTSSLLGIVAIQLSASGGHVSRSCV